MEFKLVIKIAVYNNINETIETHTKLNIKNQ